MNAESYIARDFAGEPSRVRAIGHEMPRGSDHRLYLVAASAMNAPRHDADVADHGVRRFDVWLAVFALLFGLASMPLDFGVGSMIGIPAFVYLLAASKAK